MRPRPVGTVIEVVSPPSLVSANPHPIRVTYRIVGHSRVTRFPGDTVGEPAETLEPIDYEELPAPTAVPFEALKSAAHYRAWQIDHAERVAAETPRRKRRRR